MKNLRVDDSFCSWACPPEGCRDCIEADRVRDELFEKALIFVTTGLDCWPKCDVASWASYMLEELLQARLRILKDPVQWRRAGVPKRRPINGSTRIQVFERDAYRCVRCGSWENLTVDHIIPVIAGGAHDIANFQTLCQRCNSSKGAR